MKKLGEPLFVGDKIEVDEVIYKCVQESYQCNECDIQHAQSSCIGISCSENSVILKIDTTPKYPVLLIAGESIEILGLKLLIKSAIDSCEGCIFDCRVYNSLCKQVDCKTNKVIISEETVE